MDDHTGMTRSKVDRELGNDTSNVDDVLFSSSEDAL